jgi:hypothetical protein
MRIIPKVAKATPGILRYSPILSIDVATAIIPPILAIRPYSALLCKPARLIANKEKSSPLFGFFFIRPYNIWIGEG